MKLLPSLREERCATLQHLKQEEDGAATVLGLFMLILMMFAAGIALDIMRSELDRAKLQNAIDRSVLAAAQLDQERDARIVVQDYLRAAGINPDSVRIRPVIEKDPATGRETSKTITVKAVSDVDSFFMDTFGIPELVQPISTSAIEEERNIEISLILDVSGSMAGQKTSKLKTGAKKFVEAMLNERPDLTTISVVTYDAQVSLGSKVAEYFPLSGEHSISNCVSFAESDYLSLGMPVDVNGAERIQRLGHFSQGDTSNNWLGPIAGTDMSCPTDDSDSVLAWSNDIGELSAHIDRIGAQGWTAVGKGVKMGTILLDPSSRDELEAMADDNEVSDLFRGRPVDYGTEGFSKYLIVMTDGDNTNQYDLNDKVRDGLSRIYVHHPVGSTAYFEPPNHVDANGNGAVDPGEMIEPLQTTFDGSWANNAVDETAYSIWSPTENKYWSTKQNQYVNQPDGGADARQMTNVEVFNAMSEKYILQKLLGENDGRRGAASSADRDWWRDTVLRTHDRSSNIINGKNQADRELHNICNAARDAGIVVFSIALQAPDAGEDAMRDCAGVAPGVDNNRQYYEVDDANDLGTVFEDIAASINRLKLTQ